MTEKLLFIEITGLCVDDIKYTQMLVDNWDNYYMPENYLLPNTKIVELNQHMEKVE